MSATATTPALCGACRNLATLTCSICDNMKYCSAACQQSDKRLHDTICTNFKNLGPRPGDEFHRAIYFPEDAGTPRFVWIDADDGTPVNYEDYFGKTSLGSVFVDCHLELQRQFSNNIKIDHRSTFLYDGSQPNGCLQLLAGFQVANVWRGPFLAHGWTGGIGELDFPDEESEENEKSEGSEESEEGEEGEEGEESEDNEEDKEDKEDYKDYEDDEEGKDEYLASLDLDTTALAPIIAMFKYQAYTNFLGYTMR